MSRITSSNLAALLARMVAATGAPTGDLYTKTDGGVKARVGALFIEQGSRTYGRAWKVCRMVNEAGGEQTVLRAATAADLWYAMQAWLDGYEAAQSDLLPALRGVVDMCARHNWRGNSDEPELTNARATLALAGVA